MQEQVIAKKYAKALAKASQKANDFSILQSAYKVYSEISVAFFVPKFKSIVYSHIISRDKKLALLKSLSSSDIKGISEKLLELIVDNDRISILPYVASEIKKIIDSKNNTYEATLYFRESVSKDSIDLIKEKLKHKLKVSLNITQKIDDSLDGIRLEADELGVEVVFLKDRIL